MESSISLQDIHSGCKGLGFVKWWGHDCLNHWFAGLGWSKMKREQVIKKKAGGELKFKDGTFEKARKSCYQILPLLDKSAAATCHLSVRRHIWHMKMSSGEMSHTSSQAFYFISFTGRHRRVYIYDIRKCRSKAAAAAASRQLWKTQDCRMRMRLMCKGALTAHKAANSALHWYVIDVWL